MDYERIILEFKDNIVVLTLNHPEALNAVSTQMLSELTDAMTQIEDPDNEGEMIDDPDDICPNVPQYSDKAWLKQSRSVYYSNKRRLRNGKNIIHLTLTKEI